MLERYSDSAGAYTALDSHNNHAYKTLYRAAKAKLKLRLRVTILADSSQADTKQQTQSAKLEEESPSNSCSPPTKTEQSTSELEQPTPVGNYAKYCLPNTSEGASETSKSKSNPPADLILQTEVPIPESFIDTGTT